MPLPEYCALVAVVVALGVVMLQTFCVAEHVYAAPQVPQLETVRLVPQLSGAVLLPHVAPTRVQNVASDSAVQLQTPPAQVLFAAHAVSVEA